MSERQIVCATCWQRRFEGADIEVGHAEARCAICGMVRKRWRWVPLSQAWPLAQLELRRLRGENL